MGWMDLLNVNQRGFDSYVNTLMQLEQAKKSDRMAGLANEQNKLMNSDKYDPDAKQNFIDSLLYDAFGVETKNTKGVKINEALSAIEKELYGGYESVYNDGNNNRRWLAEKLLGEYDPNRKEVLEQNSQTMQEAVNKHGEQFKAKRDNVVNKAKASFEPPSEEFLKIIQAQNRDKMNSHRR